MTKCHQCQVNKAEQLKAADFIVSLPHTQKGHDAIWVVVDRLTTKTTVTAPQLAYQFVDELFRFYGLLMNIVSD